MRILKMCAKQTISFSVLLCVFLLLIACANDKKKERSDTSIVEKDNRIEIVTENMDFQMPDTITSGWNTFIYKNKSPQTHFFLVDKYPEGKTSKDAEKLVAPVFESAMKLITEGKTEEGYAAFAKLPEWFGEVVFVGGSGLLSPNQEAQTTFKLQPGNYIVECYVKMSNGMFHTSMGMTKDLVVSTTNSGYSPLEAAISIQISSANGIVFNDTIRSGKHTFSVHFIDQIAHENFVGHDVNLVKLAENANLKELEEWMNWANPMGLIEPGPPGITFLGGANDMPAGNTAYFTATLEAGTYALIAEVPNAATKNMLKTFEVTQ